MASEFDRARMQMQDRLLRDGRLSPSARLVGISILGRVNRACGYAWPASNRVAKELGLSLRTVKNATTELERLGYFRIDRNVGGGTNHYWPCIERDANSAPPLDVEGDAKNSTVGGTKQRCRGAEYEPQSPSTNSTRTRSTENAPVGTPSGASTDSRRKQDSDLRAHKGDEQLERLISEALGPDGDEILGVLLAIEGGRPYYKMIAAARRNEIFERDLHSARLLYQQRRQPTRMSEPSETGRTDQRAPA